jgi:hypothetical protein
MSAKNTPPLSLSGTIGIYGIIGTLISAISVNSVINAIKVCIEDNGTHGNHFNHLIRIEWAGVGETLGGSLTLKEKREAGLPLLVGRPGTGFSGREGGPDKRLLGEKRT